jgi:ankyrin repeat protein
MTDLKPVAVLLAVLATAGLNAAGPDHRLADAVEQRNASLVASLVKQGADVNAAQPDGATALHWAAHCDDVATIELLLRSGERADPVNDHGVSPLALACENGNADVVERLLRAGANPHATTTTGVTALMTAARGGSLGAVKALIARGGEVEMMKVLGSSGADVKAALPDGTTPLMAAIASTRGYGAFRAGDRRERYQGPADVAAKVDGEDERVTLDAARVAIGLGVDLNATNKDGDTALHLAAGLSLDTVIPLLVEHGARLDARNKRDQTALAITTVAAVRGFYAMDPGQRKATAELLQKLGATE